MYLSAFQSLSAYLGEHIRVSQRIQRISADVRVSLRITAYLSVFQRIISYSTYLNIIIIK